ncbi:MAG: hypothetical protein ACE148_06675 [Vicinamibacterales bacterium]
MALSGAEGDRRHERPRLRDPGVRRRLALAALVFVLSLPAVTTRIYASDEIQYFAFLRSYWFDRDLSFDNEYRHFFDRGIAVSYGFHETFLERTTSTGLRVNFGTIGSAMLWAPFYGAADLVQVVRQKLGAPAVRDGYSQPYIAAVCYASAFYGFLALVMACVIACEIVRTIPEAVRIHASKTAVAATAAVAVSTPLVFYMYVAPVMAHACSAFAVALFVLVWLKVRRRWSAGGLAVLGATAALMAMVREQDAFFAVGPATDFAVALARSLRRGGLPTSAGTSPYGSLRLVAHAIAGGAAFAFAFTPQALAYLALNGRIGPSQLVDRKMTWSSPHALQVLFSPEHGLFFWTPVALLAIAGLVWLALRRQNPADTRLLALLLALMIAAQIYVAGSVESWKVAGAFGQRRFIGTTAILVVGLSVLFLTFAAAPRRARVSLVLALALCGWWNVALMLQFGAGMMDRQRLQLRENAWNAFVVVPGKLPRLAYTYLFDRASFYKKPSGQ